MYEPQAILDIIDDHTVVLLVMFATTQILQDIAMWTAVVMTRREGWISIPLPCTYLWFAHDFGVVVRFDTWFNTYDHWFLQLYWVGLLVALAIEVVFLVQASRVGRKEYLPNGTQAQWNTILLAGLAVVVICWEYQKTIWDDPLYQALASTTMYLIPLAAVPLVLRRRSAVSQSPVIYGCFAAMIILWWIATYGYYGQGFETWQYLLSGVVAFTALAGTAAWISGLRAAGRYGEPNLPTEPDPVRETVAA